MIHVSAVLGSIYNGPNALYKNPENGSYYLILRKADSTAEQFNKVCNILSEYADIGADLHRDWMRTLPSIWRRLSLSRHCKSCLRWLKNISWEKIRREITK